MFAIQTPQMITLYGLKAPNGEPAEPEGTITFEHETEDVSKCRMIVAIEDRTYTFVFGTQGPMAETSYADDETRRADEEREKEREAVEQKRLEADRRHADEANAHELRTADDTTDRDVGWDAPHEPVDLAPYDGKPLRGPFGPFDPPPGAQAAYHPGERPNG